MRVQLAEAITAEASVRQYHVYRNKQFKMANEDRLKQIACDAIDAKMTALKALSQDIWNHPELCYEEKHAHQVLTQFLEENGFSVERKFHLDTAFRAGPNNVKSQGDGPNIAVLCEYDALPGIGHACGHNLIAMLGIAASLGIQAALQAPEFTGSGKLTVMGTPAEEGGGGKVALINKGAFSDVDLAMMAHPSQFNLKKPIFLAMTEVTIRYHGKAAHAASHPWKGVNALDAAVMCYTNISHLRQQMHPAWRVHGVITKGGLKPNIIPDLTELHYYIRTPTDPEMLVLKDKVLGCVEAAAKASGCEFECEFGMSYSSLVTNDVMATLYTENAQRVGIQQETELAKVLKAGGSTDMGNVSRVVPGLHPKFYIGTPASGHTPAFATQAKTEEAEHCSLVVAKALAMTAIDFFLKPSLVQQAKDMFHKDLEAEKTAD
ncbi:xaa-Arg dipeptidase-like isoform X1 [Babylonia areolata]|uniref:xaa-Arg dipeptidase-like isoform X1 n=2 Tax=Babylonia areolata TaxID=304850 RepID=UPI003FD097F5